MIKSIYTGISLVVISFLMSHCKSNQSGEETGIKQDSLTAARKPETINPNTQYAITPPDVDYTGDYVDKYPNGIIKFTGFFRFGKRHGQWMAFYDNGIKWSECYYDKGLKQGESIVYYPNGKIHYKGWFKKDMRDSLWFYYDEAGKEIDKRAFRDDQETGLVN